MEEIFNLIVGICLILLLFGTIFYPFFMGRKLAKSDNPSKQEEGKIIMGFAIVAIALPIAIFLYGFTFGTRAGGDGNVYAFAMAYVLIILSPLISWGGVVIAKILSKQSK
ncbi:hypothetical protein ACWIUD_01995 [Helicobacter sp. 23-1044]